MMSLEGFLNVYLGLDISSSPIQFCFCNSVGQFIFSDREDSEYLQLHVDDLEHVETKFPVVIDSHKRIVASLARLAAKYAVDMPLLSDCSWSDDGVNNDDVKKKLAKRKTQDHVINKIINYILHNTESLSIKGAFVIAPSYSHKMSELFIPAHFQRIGISAQAYCKIQSACSAYGLHKTETKLKVVVFDIDREAIEISLVLIGCNGFFSVLRRKVLSCISGRLFEEKIFNLCLNCLKQKGHTPITNDLTLERIRIYSRKILDHLSTEIRFEDNMKHVLHGADVRINISRQKLKDSCRDFLNTLSNNIDAILSRESLSKAEINKVVLFGNCANIPTIQQSIQNWFSDKTLCRYEDPRRVVSMGAAIRCMENYAESVPNFHIRRKGLPMSIGFKDDEEFVVVLRRQDVPPIQRSVNFLLSGLREITMFKKTSNSFIRAIKIDIYEGDSPRVSENLRLIAICVPSTMYSGLDSSSEIELVFKLSINGVCQVDFVTVSTKINCLWSIKTCIDKGVDVPQIRAIETCLSSKDRERLECYGLLGMYLNLMQCKLKNRIQFWKTLSIYFAEDCKFYTDVWIPKLGRVSVNFEAILEITRFYRDMANFTRSIIEKYAEQSEAFIKNHDLLCRASMTADSSDERKLVADQQHTIAELNFHDLFAEAGVDPVTEYKPVQEHRIKFFLAAITKFIEQFELIAHRSLQTQDLEDTVAVAISHIQENVTNCKLSGIAGEELESIKSDEIRRTALSFISLEQKDEKEKARITRHSSYTHLAIILGEQCQNAMSNGTKLEAILWILIEVIRAELKSVQ